MWHHFSCLLDEGITKILKKRWLYEGRLRQGKNVLPDELNWLCYFERRFKSHHELSISFIFWESPHQVVMKNIVKSTKHFFWYFNTLETHSDQAPAYEKNPHSFMAHCSLPMNILWSKFAVVKRCFSYLF